MESFEKIQPRPNLQIGKLSGTKKISKVRYIVEQYFGISNLKDNVKRARFLQIDKNKYDCGYRQAAYNISRWLKILTVDRCARRQVSGLGAIKLAL